MAHPFYTGIIRGFSRSKPKWRIIDSFINATLSDVMYKPRYLSSYNEK